MKPLKMRKAGSLPDVCEENHGFHVVDVGQLLDYAALLGALLLDLFDLLLEDELGHVVEDFIVPFFAFHFVC